MTEIEIRALIEDTLPLKRSLRNQGFDEEAPFDQLDIMLDRPDAGLFRSGQKLRIRSELGKAELTYKGHFQGDASASRRVELNISIPHDEIEIYVELFSALGLPMCFQIPKTRTKFHKDSTAVVFDEWPIIDTLVEIEGEESQAKALAASIAPGVRFANYRLKEFFRQVEERTGESLETLKERYERQHGIALGSIELLLD